MNSLLTTEFSIEYITQKVINLIKGQAIVDLLANHPLPPSQPLLTSERASQLDRKHIRLESLF